MNPELLSPSSAPAAEGFVFPPEWFPHESTFLSWPNRRGASFPGEALDRHLPIFHRLVAALVDAGERVTIHCSEPEEEGEIRSALSARVLPSVKFAPVPTNEPWCRDHGPTVLRRPEDGARLAVCWNYNSWGEKYPPWDLDAAAGRSMAEACGLDIWDRRDITLEGGSLETDGRGVLMVSASSVLTASRNPGRSREELEEVLRQTTGAREILWVNGEVPGDDTDGHVDCFARFGSDGSLLVLDPRGADGEEGPLSLNARHLEAWALDRGRPFRPLPLPEPVTDAGAPLPATYANFYVANRAVLVPSFGDPGDEAALAAIGAAFPDREVVAFPSRELIWGQGGIHCLTQPLPAQHVGEHEGGNDGGV